MLDGNDLLNIIKKAALEAIEADKPFDFCFGKVTSTSPLKILVEQKMTLGAAQLVLTRNVTNYKTTMTVDWSTEKRSGGTEEDSFASHSHDISGKKEVTIHNALQKNDEVILLRKKGGQKYLVLDRVVNT